MVAVDAGDGRVDRRQVDVVVGMDAGQVGWAEPAGAMRADVQRCLEDAVRVGGKDTGDAAAAAAGLVGAAGMVRLLAAGRQRA